MRNVQRRVLDAPADRVGALLDRLATPGDPLWPAPAWPPLVLDRGLVPGSAGGHGPIRYALTEYEPGRRVRFTFDPRVGIRGYHELRVEPVTGGRCELVHVIAGRLTGATHLAWPLAIRWLHEALLADLLDNAERAATGTLRRPARWSGWVRLLRGRYAPRPVDGPLPAAATLADAARARVDLLDAWRLALPPGVPRSPDAWRTAIFDTPPAWVSGLMRLRNRLAGLVGLDRVAPREVFAELGRTERELLLGGDTRHFDLRVSVCVDGDEVVCATLTRARSRRGRAYLALVRRVHPLVVRAMLSRAARRMLTVKPAAAAG